MCLLDDKQVKQVRRIFKNLSNINDEAFFAKNN